MTGTRIGDGSPNEDLVALQDVLVDFATKLDLAIDDAPTSAAVHELNVQLAAVNARITALGRRLFASESDALSAASHDVVAAIPQAERALAELARLDAVVSGVTGVLVLTDRAIGLAKTAGV